jgi:hypothetical protein
VVEANEQQCGRKILFEMKNFGFLYFEPLKLFTQTQSFSADPLVSATLFMLLYNGTYIIYPKMG